MYDVCGFGDALIDFIPAGLSDTGNVLYEANPGGTIANVLVCLSKLGLNVAFLGKVGKDSFGRYLERELKRQRVGIKGLKYCETANTTLAFIQLDENGERSFTFYRNPGADTMILEDEIDYDIIKNSRVFHFSSMPLTSEPSRATITKALQYAKANGLVLSFDVNLRLNLWKNLEEARNEIKSKIAIVDILKMSEDEIEFITGKKSIKEASAELMQTGITLLIVTLGAAGCFYRFNHYMGYLSTYNVRVVDTTGAGDAFIGGFLYKFCASYKKLDEINISDVESMIDFANAVGALVVTKRGGIPAMPSLSEVETCMEEIPKRTTKATEYFC